jgi:dolichol-phosphate mannosyltransferase
MQQSFFNQEKINMNIINDNNIFQSEILIAVVIPCYKVKKHILNVISNIKFDIKLIYVIDDGCPENTSEFVIKNCIDPRLKVIKHEKNLGVGGAVMTGYTAAINDGADIIIKIDGDDQMDPHLAMDFAKPIINGEADYTKGNRFYNLEEIGVMPISRIFGNAILSLMAKLSTGYWNIFDTTNGYTAIHASVVRQLPFHKISRTYFFESDMLFRLNTLRAVVIDIPMSAKYGDEVSNLRINKIIIEFLWKHMCNFFKRIFYNYYLRDVSLASIELPLGIILLIFGVSFGLYNWYFNAKLGTPTAGGTVMMAELSILMGIQFLLSFTGYDISSIPKRPISRNAR